jgi:allantoicase
MNDTYGGPGRDADQVLRLARAFLQRALWLHEQATTTHVAASRLHADAVEFNELHAAAERRLGRPDRAEEMERRAATARRRSELERGRAAAEQERLERVRARLPE